MNEYAELINDVRDLKIDMYIGKGKDNLSITTRLTLIENTQERNEKMTTEKFEKYDALLNKALWLSITAVLGVFGFLLKVIFFPHIS